MVIESDHGCGMFLNDRQGSVLAGSKSAWLGSLDFSRKSANLCPGWLSNVMALVRQSVGHVCHALRRCAK